MVIVINYSVALIAKGLAVAYKIRAKYKQKY